MKIFFSLLMALTLASAGLHAQTDALGGGTSTGTTSNDALVEQFIKSWQSDLNARNLKGMRSSLASDVVLDGLDGSSSTGVDQVVNTLTTGANAGNAETEYRVEAVVRLDRNNMVVTGQFRTVDKSASDAASGTRRGTFRKEIVRNADGTLLIKRMQLRPAF